LYCSLKAHFSSKYDFLKNGVGVKVSVETFERRNDKYFFKKLAKHSYPTEFILANLIVNPDIWIGDMLESGNAVFSDWQRRTQAMVYCLTNEVEQLSTDINALITVPSGQHPPLLYHLLSHDISLETFCILNEILPFFNYWDRTIEDKVIWPTVRQKAIKYQPFLKYDRSKAKKVLQQHFSGS
jgi:hypothetical protein